MFRDNKFWYALIGSGLALFGQVVAPYLPWLVVDWLLVVLPWLIAIGVEGVEGAMEVVFRKLEGDEPR